MCRHPLQLHHQCAYPAPQITAAFEYQPPPRSYELLPREPDTPPPDASDVDADVEVVVDGSEPVEELHHRRQSSA